MWIALGVLCLIAAIVCALCTDKVEVGKNFTRLLAFLLAFYGYWYVASEIHGFDLTVHSSFWKWAVPVSLGVCALVSLILLLKNWKDETEEVMKTGFLTVAVVVLSVLARFCLSHVK